MAEPLSLSYLEWMEMSILMHRVVVCLMDDGLTLLLEMKKGLVASISPVADDPNTASS